MESMTLLIFLTLCCNSGNHNNWHLKHIPKLNEKVVLKPLFVLFNNKLFDASTEFLKADFNHIIYLSILIALLYRPL